MNILPDKMPFSQTKVDLSLLFFAAINSKCCATSTKRGCVKTASFYIVLSGGLYLVGMPQGFL